MTESQWNSCTDPFSMLEFLRDRASERKLRLLAVACHRRIFQHLKDPPASRKTLEFADRFADGLATTTELRGHAWGKPGGAFSTVLYKAFDAAHNSLELAAETVRSSVLQHDPVLYKDYQDAFYAAFRIYSPGGSRRIAEAQMPSEWIAAGNAARAEEHVAQSALIREIFGPLPFRLLEFDRSRLVPDVVNLAQRIYGDSDFRLLPALSHALEGGAQNAEILDHMRQTSSHVKGCWALDLLLLEVLQEKTYRCF
jgi:hypothetical protein